MCKDKNRNLCYDAYNNRMYLEDGAMLAWYERGQKQPSLVRTIVIAYDGSKIVAVAMLLSRLLWNTNVGVYVHPRYRRKGIATKLIKQLRKQAPERDLHPSPHDDRAVDFFKSVRKATDHWGKLLS